MLSLGLVACNDDDDDDDNDGGIFNWNDDDDDDDWIRGLNKKAFTAAARPVNAFFSESSLKLKN